MEPKTIAERAAKLGFPAVALTDRNGLYGAMPFSDACFAKGVQPIIGAMLAVARPEGLGGGGTIDWLALLAQDDSGYANLCKLVSAAHLDRPVEQDPHVELERLEGFSEGLIALTAGAEGALARLLADGQQHQAEAYLDRCRPCSRAAFMSNCRVATTQSSKGRKPRWSNSPMPAICRSWRPIRRHTRTRRSMPRTTPCCASPIRPTSKAPTASARRPTHGSRVGRRWRSCSPTFPRHSPTPP